MSFRKLVDTFKPRTKVRVTQPDQRIPVKRLGNFSLGEEGFVSHDERGCPRNAIIEYFEPKNFIRCGWCFAPLTQEAAIYVLDNAVMTEQNTFAWLRGRCPITSPART